MARLKYWDEETQAWEYADKAVSGQNDTLTAEERSTLIAVINAIGVFNTPNGQELVDAFNAAWGDSVGEIPPDEPDEPDAPEQPTKTLSSISATYSGGDVAVGTVVSALTGIVVTAHYSDGSAATVTGYTLSGTIAEGSNTITVAYGGKTAAINVVGISESGSGSDTPAVVNLFDKDTMVIAGYFWGSNAAPNPNADSKYAKIPVEAGKKYAVQKTNTYHSDHWSVGGNGAVSWVDAAGAVLGNAIDSASPNIHKDPNSKGIVTGVAPEGTAYVCFSVKVFAAGTDYSDTIMVEEGDTCHDYVAYAS